MDITDSVTPLPACSPWPQCPVTAPPTQKRPRKKKRKCGKSVKPGKPLPPVRVPPRSATPTPESQFHTPNVRIRTLKKNNTLSSSDPPIGGKEAMEKLNDRPQVKLTKEQSLQISLKNYKLPTRFPERFATFAIYKNDKGEEIPLLHRDLVTKKLMELDKDVQPVLHKFKVYYSALTEGHPQWSKAAFTNRIPLKFASDMKAFAHHIQLRVRSRQSPNDPLLFYNRSTLLAILFHELAHIRHMNHGPDFMFFLRDIYRYATRISVFRKCEKHQLPSCRKWENALFAKAGNLSDEELTSLASESAV